MEQPRAGPRPDSAAFRDCGSRLLLAGVVGAAQEQQPRRGCSVTRSKGTVSRETHSRSPMLRTNLQLQPRCRLSPQGSKPLTMGASSARCLFCGQVIDMPTESVVVIEHDGERQTSLAHQPELADRPHVLLVHGSCAPAGWSEEPN